MDYGRHCSNSSAIYLGLFFKRYITRFSLRKELQQNNFRRTLKAQSYKANVQIPRNTRPQATPISKGWSPSKACSKLHGRCQFATTITINCTLRLS